jgi:hypothetical protein
MGNNEIRFHEKWTETDAYLEIPNTMLRDISLFFSSGKGRGTNDANNKLRENILTILHRPPEEYLLDAEFGNQWQTMSLKWTTFLNTLCPVDYDDITIKKIANLSNHDLLIEYKKDTNVIHTVLGEFKHNAKSIAKLPEYYNAPESKKYIPVKYSEYFYDIYIDKLCELTNVEKIEKHIYLKYIYQPRYSINSFFQKLKDSEETLYKQKQLLVRASIQDYLQKYASTLCLEQLTHDLMPQSTKTFILWDCHEFRSDTIHEDELQIVSIERIKNNNTIVVVSKSGTRHHMLLRWKNHLGVLYPAWQISLQR